MSSKRHAAGGLAQQPSHDRPHLGRLAGRGDELDRAVVRLERRPPAALLEEPLAQASERAPAGRAGRGARAACRSSRPRPRPARRAGRGRTRDAGTAAARGAARARAAPRRARPRTRSRRGRAPGRRRPAPRLPRASARAREPLARRGEERRGVGGAALERAVEVAVEALERGEAPGVVGSRAARPRRGAARRSGAIPPRRSAVRVRARAAATGARGVPSGRRRPASPLSARSREARSASWPLVQGSEALGPGGPARPARARGRAASSRRRRRGRGRSRRGAAAARRRRRGTA